MPMEFGLLITPEDALTNNPAFTQKQPLTSNISPAIITENESLSTIFPFEFEETAAMPLFSGAAFEAKPITTMYTNAKVKEQSIKLILDSGSTDSIITRQLMNQLGCRIDQAASTRIITADRVTKTPIGKINDFSFEVNGIMTPIKVLVMEATQYQALVGNDWLSKVNAMLDWNIQELQLMYQGQHIHVSAMCGHFKTPLREKLLIKLEEEKEKPTWEAYQVFNKEKGKQKEELTWETDDLTWTDNDESEPTSSWEWEENKENKGKRKEKETTQTTTTYNTHTISQQSTYHRPKLICVNCGKKLSSMGAYCGDNEEYHTATKFYCCPCLFECFRRPKRQRKLDNQPFLTCGETLLDKGIWNNIPGHEKTCNVLCQYMILISDWVRKGTPMEAAWQRAIQQLDSCLHDDDKIWRMALTKIEEAMPEEIKTIKDNPPEPLELDWNVELIINLLDPEQFYKHYQELAPTREEQEQQLKQLNA
ncbi:hypothetical protein G9A89_005755 [Geosiphon pyriformis]|nr:hypothetical protein G9A89_005755 [Geosiphon pyriformis]